MSEARELLKEILEQHDKGFLEAHNTRARVLLKRIDAYLAKPDPDNHQVQLEHYDAGLLGDCGGGNVAWWHDYIRAYLERTHDFYQDQSGVAYPPARKPLSDDVLADLRNSKIGPKNPITLLEFKIIARAVEKAHGIAEE